MKIKLTWKIWLMIIIVVLSLLSIFGFPPTFFQDGVAITSVQTNSSAFEQGFRQGQIITQIDEYKIKNLEDFSSALQGKFQSEENEKVVFQTKDSEIIFFSKNAPDITVSNVKKTNIKTGLDLSGGARALIQAQDKELSSSEVTDLIDVINNRLNVYGITDLRIVPVSDLSGNHFILIEIAGATPKDIEDLISKQGKFEAKIGNETAFIGGERDITSVCRNDATCAGVESCDKAQDGNSYCNFRFVIYLSEEAAQRHADITENLGVNSTAQGNYLDQKLDLYLDDNLVDSLSISEGLKGRVTTQIQISGSGSGETEEDAYEDAMDSMHQLQTVLITGSLPHKLEIVKLDTISPALGGDFLKSIMFAGIAALSAVALIIFLRYKSIKPSLAMLLTMVSELIIILGIASFIDWNIDLPGIAGILATIGTGVDDQIVILDETKQSKGLSLKQRLKRAFAIIMGAYFTVVVSLLPLMWAGAGLLKGFAITTIIGVTVGVLITRPAFSDIIKSFVD